MKKLIKLLFILGAVSSTGVIMTSCKQKPPKPVIDVIDDVYNAVKKNAGKADNVLGPIVNKTIPAGCTACGGDGIIYYHNCQSCGGDGFVVDELCVNCGGSGQTDKCYSCNGSGKASSE